ncbi:hypothetical protein HS7_06400 [Sulfolobales archaeon HS-7]|nr:hypothetical protein HS7_06400 [Sulfolobales archaeon HS-7]
METIRSNMNTVKGLTLVILTILGALTIFPFLVSSATASAAVPSDAVLTTFPYPTTILPYQGYDVLLFNVTGEYTHYSSSSYAQLMGGVVDNTTITLYIAGAKYSFNLGSEYPEEYLVVETTGQAYVVLILAADSSGTPPMVVNALGTLISEGILPQGTYYGNSSGSTVPLTSSSPIYDFNPFYVESVNPQPGQTTVTVSTMIYSYIVGATQTGTLTLTIPPISLTITQILNPSFPNVGTSPNLAVGRQNVSVFVLDTVNTDHGPFRFTLIYGSTIPRQESFTVNSFVVAQVVNGMLWDEYFPSVGSIKLANGNTYSNVMLIVADHFNTTNPIVPPSPITTFPYIQYLTSSYLNGVSNGNTSVVVVLSNGTVIVQYNTNVYYLSYTTAESYSLVPASKYNLHGDKWTYSLSPTSPLTNGTVLTTISKVTGTAQENGSSQISLGADAYEMQINVTPKTTLNITFSTSGSITETAENSIYATVNYTFLSSYLYFSNVSVMINEMTPVETFVQLNMTPEFPLIEGQTNVSFKLVAQYSQVKNGYAVTFNSTPYFEYLLVSPYTYLPYYSGSVNLTKTFGTSQFGLPATTTYTSTIPLEIPGALSYIALVEFGLWNNQTTVTVVAEDYEGVTSAAYNGNQIFYPRVIPPTFSYIPEPTIGPNNAYCHVARVTVLDPSGVLYPYAPSLLSNTFNFPNVTGPWNGFSMAGFLVSVKDVKGFSNISYAISMNPEQGINPFGQLYYTDNYTLLVQFLLTSNNSEIDFVNVHGITVVQVYLTPSEISKALVNVTFVDNDFAVQYLIPSRANITAVTGFNVTSAKLILPAITPLYNQYIMGNIYDYLYTSQFVSTQLVLATNTTPPGVYLEIPGIPSYGPVQVGVLRSITVTLASGKTMNIVLSSQNVTNLFESLTLPQNGMCTGNFSFAISIPELESILGVNSTVLNGSNLTMKYYDEATNANYTASTILLLENISQGPVPTPFILNNEIVAEKTVVVNVTHTEEVVYGIEAGVTKPNVYAIDPNLAKVSTTSVQFLYLTSFKISNSMVSITGSYNGTYTNIMSTVNGMTYAVYHIPGFIESLSESSPGTGNFTGAILDLYAPEGTATAPNTTLYFVLPNGTMLALAPTQDVAYSNVVSPPINASVSVTYEDTVNSIDFTYNTYIIPSPVRPILITLYGQKSEVMTFQNNSYGIYQKLITLSATNTQIALNVTSLINYPVEFFVVANIYAGNQTSHITTGGGLQSIPILTVDNSIFPAGLGKLTPTFFPITLNLASITPGAYYTVQLVAEGYFNGIPISTSPTFLYVVVYYS